VRIREPLCAAPRVELVGEAAADGSDAGRAAACVRSLATVCRWMALDTSVVKMKKPQRELRKPFLLNELLSYEATAQKGDKLSTLHVG